MGSNLTNSIGTGLKHMGSNLRSWGSSLSNVRFTASGTSKNYGLGAQYASGLRPGAVRGPSLENSGKKLTGTYREVAGHHVHAKKGF